MTKISSARIDLEGGRVDRAILKAYGETLVGTQAGVNTGSAYTIDLSTGNIFNLILSANCTFTFTATTLTSGTAYSFTLILKQDATGGRTATWPSTVVWAGGTTPSLSAAASHFDVFSFLTLNAGSSYFGTAIGFDFS